MSRKVAVSIAALLAFCALVGCQHANDRGDNADPQHLSIPSARAATALPGDHASTRRYKIAIDYPVLSATQAPLASALRRTGEDAKREFMQALPDPKQFPEFADRQLQLLIDFKIVARANDFISVREAGMSDTGGAHPLPIDASFVYDTRSQHVIALDDLFANPDAACRQLAQFARAAVTKKMLAQTPKPGEGSPEAIKEWMANTRQMIDDGTKPSTDNFSNFVVRAAPNAADPSPGLTLIFRPYQVAAYVYGTQTVDVPTAVFGQYLNPQYRNAFGEVVVN
ncbi:MAG: DUF3298 domain-containing protein [Rhodanobacteraceae bacterium]